MEYINPTSVAGMFNQPKDTSLPGSGYGLTQGFLEGQAAARSMDFLDMAQAKQAQDYVGKQFDMQKAWEDRPFELEKRGVELDNSRAVAQGNRLSNQQKEQALENIKKQNKLDSIMSFGSAADRFAAAKNPLEQKMAWDNYVRMHKFAGLPVDDDLTWDGNPETWQNIVQASQLARELASFHNQYASQRALTGMQESGNTARNDSTNRSKERIEAEGNATALAIAKIRAEADKATQGGGNAWNSFREQLGRDWQRVVSKFKAKETLTPDEEAIMSIAPQILAGAVTSTQIKTDPNVIRQGAEAKTGGDLNAINEALSGKPSPNKPAPQGTPLPESEQDLQKRLQRYP